MTNDFIFHMYIVYKKINTKENLARHYEQL